MGFNFIQIKADKRFKYGNIKQTGNVVRGNPDTLDMHRMIMDGMPVAQQLNPPIVVSHELGEAIKKSLR